MPFVLNQPTVVFDDFGDEALLLHLQTGAYYSVRFQALEALRFVLAGGVLSDEAGARFLGQLVDEQLLRSDPEGIPSEGPPPVFPAETLKLEKFTDMADALAMDPIHDTDDQGWPHAAAG